MNRGDVEKLLGGYAAGTLTADEREALFAAALEDQQIFESLATEEPLRELLQDPAAKAQLLAALNNRRVPWLRRVWAPAFGVAAATAMILMAYFSRPERPKPEPVVVAETKRVPVRSFQPPLPVEGSPLPTALPPPPKLPGTAAPSSLQALNTITKPVAPPASAAANAADAESAKVNPEAMVTAGRPAFRALNFAAVPRGAEAAARMGLHYTVYKKSASGELTEVYPQTELERSDQVVVTFESTMPGLLSVSRPNPPNGSRSIANEQLQPAVPVTVPVGEADRPGANELLVRFSPLTAAALKKAESSGGAVGGFAPQVAPETAVFNITLQYK